jgi:phosphoribosyl-AMP cyclohydrolase
MVSKGAATPFFSLLAAVGRVLYRAGPAFDTEARRMTAATTEPNSAAFLDTIRFDGRGLVAAVAQQHDTGEVLMLAWMNREAAAETLRTGRVCYWSRSRGALWRKGETSGQAQKLVEMRLDCDGDALLLLVDQAGVACHTGRRSCFYRAARDGAAVEIAAPAVDPAALYGQR